MNNSIKSSFNLNLTVLNFLGLYPGKNPSKIYLFYGYLLLFSLSLSDPILCLLYFYEDEELVFFEAGISFFVVVAMIVCIPKMLPLLINNKKIGECVYYLDLALNITLNKKQKIITEDCVWVCQRNTKFFFVCLVLNEIAWICRPLFSSRRELPLEVWLPFDPTTNGVVYFCIYGFVATGLTYIVFSNAAVDTLISGLAYHAAGQIKILKDNLEFLFDYSEEVVPRRCENYETVKNRVIFQKIRECSQHHQHIISFVEKFESCFSWVLFSQLFVSTLMVGLCTFQLSQDGKSGGNLFIEVACVISLLFELYFYCYYGTTLFEESNTLATAAYLGPWYEYDLKSQKALLLFMERAKIPMTVTAGKILDLSLYTFTNVLKKSYSLLAVLKNY